VEQALGLVVNGLDQVRICNERVLTLPTSLVVPALRIEVGGVQARVGWHLVPSAPRTSRLRQSHRVHLTPMSIHLSQALSHRLPIIRVMTHKRLRVRSSAEVMFSSNQPFNVFIALQRVSSGPEEETHLRTLNLVQRMILSKFVLYLERKRIQLALFYPKAQNFVVHPQMTLHQLMVIQANHTSHRNQRFSS